MPSIKKTSLVALLVALGMSKAKDWDNDKLIKKAEMLHSKTDRESVPEEHLDLYDSLDLEKDDSAIELEEDDAEAEDDADGAEDDVEEQEEDSEEEGGEDEADEEEKPKKADKKKSKKTDKADAKKIAKGAKADKSEKKKKKADKPAKVEVATDDFGSREGTISAKVNAVVDTEWKSDIELAEEAGVSLEQARGRLYYGTQDGHFEMERVARYRLKPKKASKKAS